jgi:hypothetical protein
MTKINLKISVIAMAIGIFAVSCGGGSKQSSGSATPETKTEKAAATKGSGKMVAFDESEAKSAYLDDFYEVTGLKGIGKPVGYKFKGVGHSATVLTLDFIPEGDIKQQDIDDYARALWDLCSKVTKKPLYNWKNEPLKSFDDARREAGQFFGYLWYYNTADRRLRTTVVVEKNNTTDEMEFEVKFEHKLLEK